MKPLGGKYEIDGYLNTLFNPGKLNIGNHKLIYLVNSKSCFTKDSFDIVILDSIHLILSPNSDSLCGFKITFIGIGKKWNFDFSSNSTKLLLISTI